MPSLSFDADRDNEEYSRYRRRSGLIMRKLASYIPVMIVTNISLLLINTVDKIVAAKGSSVNSGDVLITLK